jgi:hypothetical protein
MGKNQKKKEPPQWRFELHQSVDALVPVPSARGGKKGGGKHSTGGEERAGAEKPPNGDWDQIDPAVFCELVPTLPRDLVFTMCATERAAGAPVQEALDRLLALSLREKPASSGQGPSQPTLRVARGVSVRVPQGEAGAPVPRPPVRDGDMGSLRLWALPVEICGEICATLGGASPATLGRLAQSCTGCRAVVAAWLRHDVGSAGLGLGSNHCFGVGGAAWWAPVAAPSACVQQSSTLLTDGGHTARFRLSVSGSWGGERGVRLARQLGSLQLLAVDCQAQGGFSTAAVAALWARESARLLGGLRALRLLGCDEADEAAFASLAHRCPQLTALDLSGCPQLSGDALSALATLQHLRALSLASNPQLNATALQALLRGCPLLRVADLSHCDGASPGHASLRTAPHHSLFGAEHLSPPPPAPPQPAAAAAPPLPRAPAARGAARAGWGALPLQELYLRGWVRLTALSLGSGCVRLASLDLSSCVSLGSLQLQLPALTTLSATTCPKLEVVVLECPALHSLSLAQAKLLHALQADSSTELQSLNLYGCRQLTASHLSALLRVAGASLRALNLNGAFGTEEVSRELIMQSCPRLALLDDKGRVRKH